jgi:hypothetical protein
VTAKKAMIGRSVSAGGFNRPITLLLRGFSPRAGLEPKGYLITTVSRPFSYSAPARDIYEPSHDMKPSEETEDVTAMDNFMSVVRASPSLNGF